MPNSSKIGVSGVELDLADQFGLERLTNSTTLPYFLFVVDPDAVKSSLT